MTQPFETPRLARGLTLIASSMLALVASVSDAHDVEHDTPHHSEHTARTEHAGEHTRELVTAFRVTGDDKHLDAAWAALEHEIEHDDVTVDLLVDAAVVAQARHDFDLAHDLLDRALARAPNHDAAWLQAAAIHLVGGNHEQADQACHRLRRVSLLVITTCHARVDIARGEAEAALRGLEAVLEVLDRSAVAPELLAWTLSVAGDAAAVAAPERAVAHYRASLALAERTQVRAALVDVLLALGRHDAALGALDAGHDALPLVVRRMIVATRTGRRVEMSEAIERADARFRAWIAAADWAHSREMARFYIDVEPRPALAKRLARINLSIQREPEDLRLAPLAGAPSR